MFSSPLITDHLVIDKALSATDIAIKSQQALTMTQGESISIANSQFTYACETPDSFTIQNGENYTFVEETITPNEDFVGTLLVNVVANKNGVSSENNVVSITVEAKPEPIPEPIPEPTPAPESSKSSGSLFWLLLFTIILPWRIGFLVKAK